MAKKKETGRFKPQRLLALRRQRGLSLRQFAAKIRRTGSMVQLMESWRIEPSMETLQRIADVFDVDAKEFLT